MNPGRIFVRCILGVLTLSIFCLASTYWNIYGPAKMFGDFGTFRMAAVHAIGGDLPAIYDINNLKSLFESGTLKEFTYFLNPPTGLFLVWPLGFLGYAPGLILWSAAQLLLLWFALNRPYFRQLLAPSGTDGVNTPLLLTVTCLAFALQNLLFGQVASLCTALLLLVIAWRKTRPMLAGVMLGLLSFKPQLGVLLPLLLLAESNKKALLAAILTAALMAALSVALWGGGLWHDYAQMLAIRSRFLAANPSLLFIICTSAYAAIRNLGLDAPASMLCQGGLAILVIMLLWPALRKGKEIDKILMLIFATYLVLPYSLIYDMVPLALPTALLMRRAEADKAGRGELILLVLLVLLPFAALLLQIAHIPYSIIAIGLGFGVARRLANKPNG